LGITEVVSIPHKNSRAAGAKRFDIQTFSVGESQRFAASRSGTYLYWGSSYTAAPT